MNEIVSNFLLAGNKFMPEMHLRQPEFTYSTCEPFTKNKEKLKETLKNLKNLKKREIYKIFIKIN